MLRTLVWPALAFLSGLGALKAAIPLQSVALMAVGLALSCFGLLRLILREPSDAAPARRAGRTGRAARSMAERRH